AALLDPPVRERRDAGNRGRRMTGAGRRGENRLRGRVIGVADATADVTGIDARAGLDVGSRCDDFGFRPVAGRGAASGEADHVHRIVRAARSGAATIGPLRTQVFRRADGNHVLAGRGRGYRGRTRSRVRGREQHDQFLLAGRIRVGVAGARVVRLVTVVVGARRKRETPGIGVDATAALPHALDNTGIVVAATGDVVAGNEDRGARDAAERIDAEAELVAVGILVRGARGLVPARDDTGIERAVTVFGTDRGVRQAGTVVEVRDPARTADLAADMQHLVGGVDCRGAGATFVDRAVGHVDDRVVIRILAEAEIREVLQIADRPRAGHEIADQDEILLLVHLAAFAAQADEGHVRTFGNRGDIGEPRANLHVRERQDRRPVERQFAGPERRLLV